jgi:class 3 adenylate cyclase
VEEACTVERKLAAIFSTDVKGYSRLMGEDEVATIHTITAYRELMATLIQQHRGRVVDSPGDNLLAEFPSVVEAVQCAVTVQQELKAKNAELPPHRRMEFRIGINLGDVITESERLYGDGVNIAARLEGLAEAGGICISGTVYDQVKTRLDLGHVDLGAQAVKNITEPVRVYRVLMEPRAGVGAAERAIDLDPNDAEGYATLAQILSYAGRPEDAIGMVQKAMRLNPHYPAAYLTDLGHAYYLTRRYEEAMAALKRALIRAPDFLPTHAYLAAIYSE